MNFKTAIILGAGFYIGYATLEALDKALGRLCDRDTWSEATEAVKEILEKRGYKFEDRTKDKIIGFKA